ncbi:MULTISPECIES: DUF4252 domain-containing protein [Flavobacterium]|jgi:hypothetical protein|uniref:DUF4252 domain-containing protein n=1 Tax=Flavobacterium macrobrachii TaxID=591204 RepID=A0ABS2CWG7_9FLAO|nr:MULTISPECIES: DUF4252 domain-containing protein [Flavobacterium]MBM6499312.1 DUF4252 domain-containing protein [Flavobacterium macrobrachii]MCZ8090488.1 DUF4252 domain-containing protein [Flavobacterium sp.]
MKFSFIIAILIAVLLSSCNDEQSLQRYFVNNSENKDFIVLDVTSTILNLDKAKLSSEQKTALESFDKLNILAFRKDSTNAPKFETESKKVNQILKAKEYQELMKVNSGTDVASVSFVGSEDNIKEFIFYAKRDENGFAVVRVLGEDMNPNNILTLMTVLKESKIDLEQLKPLEGLMK